MRIPNFPKNADYRVGVRVPILEGDASVEHVKDVTHHVVDEMFRKLHISKASTWEIKIIPLDEPDFKGLAVDGTITAFLKDVI